VDRRREAAHAGSGDDVMRTRRQTAAAGAGATTRSSRLEERTRNRLHLVRPLRDRGEEFAGRLGAKGALQGGDVLRRLGPLVAHLRRRLEMEQIAVRAADSERLVGAHGGAREAHCAFRQVEGVAVPLEREHCPGQLGDTGSASASSVSSTGRRLASGAGPG
jgi:hypothetical protein